MRRHVRCCIAFFQSDHLYFVTCVLLSCAYRFVASVTKYSKKVNREYNVMDQEIIDFLVNIGFRPTSIHRSFDHFDFSRGSRIILVIGPMGAGKTEFVTRVWRDAEVARRKSSTVGALTTTLDGADRRNIFIVKNSLDALRFSHNPPRSLSYRGGYIDCGDSIAEIKDSFDLERLLEAYPQYGTWIIDEAGFYDERIAFVMKRYAHEKELVFICPTLSLNFRKGIFNTTANFLIEYASDTFPLTAYCEHADCLKDAVYTYRYYLIKLQGNEHTKIPALYFDPLIMVGGDTLRIDAHTPNYEARCAQHHFLPGKEYTYMVLKPYAARALNSDSTLLIRELNAIQHNLSKSELYRDFIDRYHENNERKEQALSALSIPCIAERAVVYLYSEANILDGQMVKRLAKELALDTEYMQKVLSENGRCMSL